MDALASRAARVLPDYAGSSIANLMSSIALAFDVPHAACPPLSLPCAQLRAHSHVVLLLVDGLGLHALMRHRPRGALAEHFRGSLTSVFPSTTAAAITTLLTGVPPAAHAVTGWHVWLEEIDAIAAVLPGQVRGSDEPIARRANGRSLFDQRPFADLLGVDTHVVAPRRIVDTTFNLAHTGRAMRHGYTTLAQFFDAVERCVRQRSGRSYTYAYWPELDSIAHEYGVDSVRAADSLRRFDQGFARLLTALRGRDVAVVVTGDHGLVDAPPEEAIELDAHPALARLLARPLCGERRAAYCYVGEENRRAFEDYVRNELGTRADLHESGALILEGWFGPGPAHAALASRVGDYVLIPRGRATVKDWLPGEKRYRQIGVHGGLSEGEMLVPLIVAEP